MWVLHEVQADLVAAGYVVFPYVLPAAAVNAPHRRDRIWFIAYAKNYGCNERGADINGWKEHKSCNGDKIRNFTTTNGEQRTTPNPETTKNTMLNGVADREGKSSRGKLQQRQAERESGGCNSKQNVTDTGYTGLEGSKVGGSIGGSRSESHQLSSRFICSKWQNFPTVPPIRLRDDGVSNKLLRFVVNKFYDTISYTSKKNRIQNLQEVWEHIQQEEIWKQIRGLYSLESKNVLLQTMQLYSGEYKEQEFSSPFSEKLCEPIMQHLRKHKEFRCSPQGQELEKQRTEQFGNSLSFLPHEVALAARRFETAVAKFESWHRNESIKAAGNAIVPQVALQIFKTIQQYETLPRMADTI